MPELEGVGPSLPKAMLYLGPVGRGNSQPQKFVLDSGVGLCAVKFQQNPQGPRMLPNEWIGYGLAARLGIRHAAYGLVDVPAEALPNEGCLLIHDDDGDEVRLLPGVHFYSKWLEPAEDLRPEDLGLAGMVADLGMLAGVAVLDALLGQWDRKLVNPNLLTVRQHGRSTLYLMDLGMAFGSAIWGLGDLLYTSLPEVEAPLPYSVPPAPLLRAVRAPDFEPYLAGVATLTAEDFQTIVDGLPAAWGVTVDERRELVNCLSRRAKELPAFFEARFGRSAQQNAGLGEREWWQ